MDERDERIALVRMRYVGRPGQLDDPRLAGLKHIGPGHAVDMPRWLAEEMVAQGLFVSEEDYQPGIVESENQEPGKESPGEGDLEHDGMADGEGATMQSFVEINDGPAGKSGRPILEIEGALTPGALTPGVLPGLGALRLEVLAQAGAGDWESLAALGDEECEALAERMTALSGDQVKQWRDAALAHLAGK